MVLPCSEQDKQRLGGMREADIWGRHTPQCDWRIGFPEGSDEKRQAFLLMPGLGFYPEGND